MILTEPLTLDTLLITVDGALNKRLTQEIRLDVRRGLTFGTRQFVLDVSHLTGIDSEGIEELLVITQDLRKAGGNWEILNPSEPIKDRLEQCGIPSQISVRYAKLATWPGSLME